MFRCFLRLSAVGAAVFGLATTGLSATAEEKAFSQLSTHDEIVAELADIEANAHPHVRIKTGPLIRNRDNGGLINIDRRLRRDLNVNQAVCGEDVHRPKIRDAVICTVTQDQFSERGNTDPSLIGYSNNGRALMAARIGNRHGTRVYIITQQHGNEPAGTEAALTLLKRLTRNEDALNNALDTLDILFVIRGNPDGGEPTTDCVNALPAPTPGPFFGDCALTRTNLDPMAGGGFQSDSEPDFAGVVGEGYDPNRYHYVGLGAAIRPVENQAMVAAALAFRPDYVLDLHGDLPKTDCVTVFPPTGTILGGALPITECVTPGLPEDARKFSVFAETTADSMDREIETRALGARILKRIDRKTAGTVGRFSQVQLGSGVVEELGTTTAYQVLGAVTGGWESANFTSELRPAQQAFFVGAPPGTGIGPAPFLVDPAILDEQIELNLAALRTALRVIARFQSHPPNTDRGFCDFPLATGLIGDLPPGLWGPAGTAGDVTVPISPEILGPALFISGVCPTDVIAPPPPQ